MTIMKKVSFAKKFCSITLLNIGGIVLILFLIFFSNLRDIMSREAGTNVDETILRLQKEIQANLDEHAVLLKETALTVSSLFALQSDVPRDLLALFLNYASKTLPGSPLLYYASNERWDLPDAYFLFSEEWIPSADYDQTQRSWFQDAKKADGKIAYSKPYLDMVKNRLTASLSMTVFDRAGKDIGVAAVDVTVDNLIDLLNSVNNDTDQSVYLISREGLFISHPDRNAILKKDFFTELGLERYRANVLSTQSFTADDKQVFIRSVAIPDADWLIVSVIPSKSVYAETNKLFMRLVIITSVLLLSALTISIIFTRKMLILPIRGVERVAGLLAKMDFSINFPSFSDDEIGDMQHALIKIRDSLKKSTDEISQNLTASAKHRQELKTIIVESSNSLKVITDSMEAMKEKESSQLGSASKASSSLQEIVHQIELLDQTIHNQAAYITESSAAVEEMIANLESVRAVVSGTSKTTAALIKSSTVGRKMLTQLAGELSSIEEQSKTLQTANKTIADIAGQTNILAMNAAIEAAHAGESGKGFAVVAGEIRKLAELSSKESESISTEIKKMERVIESIGKVSSETVGSMDAIFSEITAMDNAFSMIKNAVEEQASGSTQILVTLKGIRDTTTQVKDGSGSIHQKSETISREMGVLNNASQEVTKSMHEIRIASNSIDSFLENAKEMANSFS